MRKYLLLTIVTALCLQQATAQPQREAVAPLLQTAWGLRAPYNNLCPTINGQHCETGCVATAMAQVMRYYQHPVESPEIPAYTTQTKQLAMSELPATTFDWAHMTPTYSSSSTDEERTAVAKLMQYCGAAIRMDYDTWASAAWEGDAMVALESLFGYASSTRELYRYMYDDVAWENILYNELSKGRPVIYGAVPAGWEHQFVCDGYKDGKFHFNMGWTITSTGYYSINEIDNYNFHSAIVGIKKDDGVVYGLTFTQGPLTYTILDNDEVSVCSDSDNQPQGAVAIPATVSHDGHTYRVTIIDYEAFANNSEITSLHIPASVIAITRETIKACPNLTTITVDEGNTAYHMVDGKLMTITNDEVVAQTATTLAAVSAHLSHPHTRYYNLKGVELTSPQRGLNIVKTTIGTNKGTIK